MHQNTKPRSRENTASSLAFTYSSCHIQRYFLALLLLEIVHTSRDLLRSVKYFLCRVWSSQARTLLSGGTSSDEADQKKKRKTKGKQAREIRKLWKAFRKSSIALRLSPSSSSSSFSFVALLCYLSPCCDIQTELGCRYRFKKAAAALSLSLSLSLSLFLFLSLSPSKLLISIANFSSRRYWKT